MRSDANLAKLSDSNVETLVAILALGCDSRNGSNYDANFRTHWALIGSDGLVQAVGCEGYLRSMVRWIYMINCVG